MQKGFTLWFTGLSGAGKSTLSSLVAERIRQSGRPVELLDGDAVRTHLSRGLGFTKEDRDINVLRIGFVANLLSRNGVVAITAAISPYRQTRDEVRGMVTRDGAAFVEVFVQCALPVLAERDVKGLYKRAMAGEIPHFTGVSDPYEAPLAPEITVSSDCESVEASLATIVRRLTELGHLT